MLFSPRLILSLLCASRLAFAFQGNQVEPILQARRDAKEQARQDRLAAEEAERILVSDCGKPALS